MVVLAALAAQQPCICPVSLESHSRTAAVCSVSARTNAERVCLCVCAVTMVPRAQRGRLLVLAHSSSSSTCRQLARPHLKMRQEPGCIFPHVYF